MNRLATESSPYLRQHADNPVDWFPWGAQAFDEAKASNRPVLLSVGYSACHWCHVMAHESFEDEATAKVMNELFVNIKVDREERPDVDAIYMEAVQAMSGQGGWPMTVFLTPDAKPFFAGTYFPKEPTQGHPGFVSVLQAVDDAWRTQQSELQGQANELQQAISERVQTQPADGIDLAVDGPQWITAGVSALVGAADREWGGFGRAPKFPQLDALDALLADGSPEAIDIATSSLDAMASGGIYDHLGGGFSRYSVDAFWMVPHFEKMLYDNAGFIRVYTHAYQVTGEERYKRIVEETVGYVLRDLAAGNGGIFSAEDADSEGEEGKFYIWRPEAIDAALDDTELAASVKNWFGVTANGNFEGSNILHLPKRGQWMRSEELDRACATLLATRSERVRPGLDNKVLTEWNAMFCAALAEAGAALDRKDWVDAAVSCAEFLLSTLATNEGRWLRTWHPEGGAKQLAFANDYAWLLQAFLALRAATGETRWLTHAQQCAQSMQELFWDDEHGGLLTVGHDAEALIVASKDLFDGATASANSTAATGLAQLALLTGDARYREWAQGIVALVAEPMAHHPTAFTAMLAALRYLGPDATETVVAGNHDELVRAVQHMFLPANVLSWGERDDTELWTGRDNGAYVCQNMTCQAPVFSAEDLRAALR